MSNTGIKFISIQIGEDVGNVVELTYEEWRVVFNALKPIFEPAQQYVSPWTPHIDDVYGPLRSPCDPVIGPGLVPNSPYTSPNTIWCSDTDQVGVTKVTFNDD